MDLEVNRGDFLNELIPMQGIVERRTTIPILSHLLLRASDDKIYISATDLEVSLTSWCDSSVAEEGAIAIQARKLIEIIRASSGEKVSMRLEDSGYLRISIGKSIFKIRGLASEDFPTLPNIEVEESIELPFSAFRNMITKIIFAISTEESRFQLSGAFLQMRNSIVSLVATDGHRLALVESEVENLQSEEEGVLIPRKALQELQRFDEVDMRFSRSEHHLCFSVGRRKLICRVLEGTFPDYEKVISKDNDKKIEFDRQELAAVIHRVSLLTGDRARAIKLQLSSGNLTLSAANPDLGEAREVIACDYHGDELSLGVNPDYLSQFLGAADTERIRLEFKDENSQCIVYPVEGLDKRYICVIMPIRL